MIFEDQNASFGALVGGVSNPMDDSSSWGFSWDKGIPPAGYLGTAWLIDRLIE